MALTRVPDGELAAIVTHLEMRDRPPPRPFPIAPLHMVEWPQPNLDRYRGLFRRVGAHWLWFSRLTMSDAALTAILSDNGVRVHAVIDRSGIEVGMVELDFRTAGECEIAYLGLVPDLAARGHGGWLMAETLMRAWRKGVTRVHVHTCTLDHPKALGFYRRSGFVAYAREVETFPDPRLSGLLPADTAPQFPVIRPSS